MPLNVKRFCGSILLASFVFIISSFGQGQPVPAKEPANDTTEKEEKVLTAAEIMHQRVGKAKAFIAVRNYASAIHELEMIRRETSDPSVHAVANVLLMNSYFEQGNYKRAQQFLTDLFSSYRSNNAHSETYYSAVAGQVIKGSRSRVERYRTLGIALNDRSLPLEAINDIEQMRLTLELIIEQAREVGVEKERTAVLMPLLEEATAARGLLARDDYDARRWRDEIADAREQIANAQSVVLSAIVETPLAEPETAPALPVATKEFVITEEKAEPKEASPVDAEPVKSDEGRPVKVIGASQTTVSESEENKNSAPASSPDEPIEAGALNGYAVNNPPPQYPAAARQLRATGIVRVDIVVDEEGNVAEIKKMQGHTLLQNAARDAIKKWKFKPFTRDGRPVSAVGFINFNFSL
ncbi:MAG: energy transducer TonB [Acidobacteria bacterium]|nr:energy transducer TonB [Acidobacteriota bacterium]